MHAACVLASACVAAAAGPLGVKQVAAPPEDIASGFVTLPEPDQLGVRSTTALLPIRPDARDPARAEPIRFTTGDHRPAAVVIISDDDWTARIDDASGRALFAGTHDPAADAQATPADAHRVDANLPALLGGVAATRLDLGRTPGQHTLDLSAARGFVLIDPGADVSLYTHPMTLERVAMVPVCWVAQLGESVRRLAIDLRWVALAGVDPATLELRNLRSHDVESYSLIGFRERFALAPLHAAAIPEAPAAVTDDMRTGRPGAVTVASSISEQPTPRTAGPGHRLFLVHGYCSGGNPFPLSHFTGAVAAFADPDQNRSHDQFAQTLLAQGAPMKSYGVVGHSQGGNAALHLSTFYWSGLDWARGERPIQGLGVPFQGTPLAGNAAVLGQIFGTGCGSNADLAPAGAAVWLTLIPGAERAKVWYWTTAFEDRVFVFDCCNIVSDLLLSDPEDGVVERARGQLPGGNNMGHTEGWCHTTGMRDPAQTTDAARNSQMNQRAAR